jgi:hypothetical protein
MSEELAMKPLDSARETIFVVAGGVTVKRAVCSWCWSSLRFSTSAAY